MTMPEERFRAIDSTYAFLLELASGKFEASEEVRDVARYLLRHYPNSFDLQCLSDLAPSVIRVPNYSCTTKLVLNVDYGGFSLSKKALEALSLDDSWIGRNMKRHDPRLVKVVEELGEEAWGDYACLEVVTIPGTCYRIDEYDGWESVEIPDSIDWTYV